VTRAAASAGASPLAADGPDVSQIMRDAVRAGTPTALLAIIPYLTGFEPGASFVVVGFRDYDVKVTLRYDLDGTAAGDRIALHAISVLASQHLTAVSAVGYGSAALVCPLAGALREAAAGARTQARLILRAENKRYWSCRCAPGRCRHTGRVYGARQHPAAAALAAAGMTVLPSRAALAATVAPADGPVRDSMRRATRLAEKSLHQAARLHHQRGRRARRAAIADSGFTAVSRLISRYRSGRRSASLYHSAWLALLLRQRRVRDDAWARMDPRCAAAHLRLWTDIVRLAEPGYVAAPASLLAFVAWQSGNGALANVALDRALADDPRYPMAKLLRGVIAGGAPPSSARIPLTPEEAAAAFADDY
jgi:Domain of unknown function (DUF4192)